VRGDPDRGLGRQSSLVARQLCGPGSGWWARGCVGRLARSEEAFRGASGTAHRRAPGATGRAGRGSAGRCRDRRGCRPSLASRPDRQARARPRRCLPRRLPARSGRLVGPGSRRPTPVGPRRAGAAARRPRRPAARRPGRDRRAGRLRGAQPRAAGADAARARPPQVRAGGRRRCGRVRLRHLQRPPATRRHRDADGLVAGQAVLRLSVSPGAGATRPRLRASRPSNHL
jgi:hypothetical protein